MKLNLGSHDYVQTLKGQKLTFPDFDGLLQDFPTGISPHYETLKGVINAELKMYVDHSIRGCLVLRQVAWMCTTMPVLRR